jgi:2,3-dihydroxybiphenyl 1,2-dioxygenase
MGQVTELGYVGLGVKDLAVWKDFAANILALEVDDDGPGRAFLRMDYWRYRLFLQEDGTDDLCMLGFRVAGPEAFRAMARDLADAGVAVQIGTPAEADARHVLEVMKLNDASGYPIEIFHGPHIQPHRPFHPGRRMHGRFKTGSGGMGHLIHRETVGFEKTCEFYNLLGLTGGIEYKIPIPGAPRPVEILFLHCNERDHTIAFGPPGSKRINHLMFEMENFDDVGLTYEIVQQAGLPMAMTPGRHANDDMYSFYFMNPSGWMCEIGWGGRPATKQSEYYSRDTYGHAPVAGVMGGVMQIDS